MDVLLANFLRGIGVVLDLILNFYYLVVIVAVIASWIGADPRNAIVRFLRAVTEPLFYQIRRWLPATGALDFSPLIVLLAIYFIQAFLVRSLYDLANRLSP